MTIARKNIVQDNFCAHYHIYNRCVQRAFLTGYDPITQTSFEHRKEWILQRLKLLSRIFTIEIGGVAIMDNHYHLHIKTRPDLLEKLSDIDIVDRWFLLYPPKLKDDKIHPEIQVINKKLKLLNQKERVKELRARLGKVPEFMSALNSHIAVKANKESNTSGRFWQGRYKCQLATTQEASLMMQVYIDLNPIRANMAKSPEESKYTSAYEHIQHDQNKIKLKEALQTRKKIKQENKNKKEKQDLPEDVKEKVREMFKNRHRSKFLASFYQGEKQERPFFHIKKEEYLELLDWSGREVRADKRGAIPANLKPIFERLKIDHQLWVESLKNYSNWFYKIIGKVSEGWKLLTNTTAKWFKGTEHNIKVFGS